MSHLQYLPGDPRLVDQLVYELKSKGIFDQFRKECIADVDTRPAYQNLRQRVESSVATFLSRQVWKPDLNKNQLREKLRKHLLDGNYLEQGVERIVDQVVNPKVASVFIPQVEDLVYNYLGIPRQKPAGPETSNGKEENLLPTDLEAVSPGSVKSNDEKDMDTSESQDEKMDVDEKTKPDIKDDSITFESFDKEKEDTKLSGISELTIHDSDSVSIDKNTITIPLPAEIKLENIPAPENSPPNIKDKKIDLEKIDLPQEPNLSTDIPLPDEIPKVETDSYFKPIALHSEDDDSSNSSIQRNVSPLTPIRNFVNENSCDAQQAFENDSDSKADDKKEPSCFRFTIESKSSENSSDAIKTEKKEEPSSYQFNIPTINTFTTPVYDDSSNSHNLQIDYESDANSKIPELKAPEPDQNSVDSHKKDKKDDKRSSSHKSSHRSRDSHRHSSSKDKRSDSKHSSSRDSSRHDKKSSRDDKNKSSEKKSDKEKPSDKNDKGDKKDSRESSKHRSSSHRDSKSSSHKDSKPRSSSSSKHSSKDEKDRKSSSSSNRDKDKERSSDKSKDNKDKAKDYKSSSRDKDRKSSSSSKKSDDKENKEKKEKKEVDDHYSLSGRGNPNRRSTDRDSNDGSSSSKGSHNPRQAKSGGSKKESKSSSKSGSTSSSDSTSPSDGVEVMTAKNVPQTKPVVRVDTCLENPISTPPRLPFVPDVTLKKPKYAENMQEARQLMKMRKFLEEEQKKMNQEAALLLEFQANVRPSLSQVYSSIPGPELEFACMSNGQPHTQVVILEDPSKNNLKNCIDDVENIEVDNNTTNVKSTVKTEDKHDEIAKTLIAMHEDGSTSKVESIEAVEAIVEHTDASVLEDLTDQEDDTKAMVEKLKIPEVEVEVPDVKVEMPEEGVVIVIESVDNNDDIEHIKNLQEDTGETNSQYNTNVEATLTIEDLTETGINPKSKEVKQDFEHPEENPLKYFTNLEQYESELERDKFNSFFKRYTNVTSSKMFLVNCDSYKENLIREVAQGFGKIEIVNYYKNGHLKLPKPSKNIVKDINVATEIVLPAKQVERPETPNSSCYTPPVFSPTKSECSFELSSDYDAKLEEMVNKTSRQEIMEIILGGAMDDCQSEMPKIDFCMESNIEDHNDMKRKYCEESMANNNVPVLTPNKLRKMSCSDQISSTTEESIETPNNKSQNATRSKYLGKARRVGLPKPKKSNIQNSPSSDKSVENYQQDETPNGKMRNTPRTKVQRYDTSDLYKPKLHYLSRRNNIS